MRKFFLLLLLAAALLFCVIGYNAWIETEEVRLSSPQLPSAFDGFRVLLLSDLHARRFGDDNEKLLKAVSSAQPDLIALCGDLLDAREQIAGAASLAEKLVRIAPCYYVTGNHEWAAGCVNDFEAALSEAGVILLDDSYTLVERQGESIVLAGFCDPNGHTDAMTRQQLMESIRTAHPDAYVLLLNHRNEPPGTFAAMGVQSVLSGHGHGGVVRLPFVGGLLDTDRSFFPAYTSGLYTAGETKLLVSRGLGGARILCRPHLPVAVLQAEKVNKS